MGFGFTQIDFAGSSTNNSMLFLQPRRQQEPIHLRSVDGGGWRSAGNVLPMQEQRHSHDGTGRYRLSGH
jgi:hypothetical protein